MNLRLLWLASFASFLLGLSGPSLLDKHLYSDPSGHHLENGCSIDPNGAACRPRPGGASAAGGSAMDPNGQ